MRRRTENLGGAVLDIMSIGPWWVGPLLALAAFLFFWFAVPLMLGGAGTPHNSQELPRHVFSNLSVVFAPWVGLIVFAGWVVVRGRKFLDRQLLDRQDGLSSIRDLSWEEFERLVGEAYRRQEYDVVHTGSPAGDGGVDLVLRRDGRTILVQCKHWKAWKVGVKEVRELLGVVTSEGAQSGILVTSGSFTAEAVDFASRNAITLVAGPELARMIHSVQTTGRTKDDGGIDLPASGTTVAPTCPDCGATMKRRTATHGKFAGQPFWGCSRFPACRGKRQA